MKTNNNNPYMIFGENSFKAFTDELNNILERSLRENSKPVIKGEITKGKLKHRGIRLVIRHDGSRYLEQRGKRISEIINLPGIEFYPLKYTKGLTKQELKQFIEEWQKNNGIIYQRVSPDKVNWIEASCIKDKPSLLIMSLESIPKGLAVDNIIYIAQHGGFIPYIKEIPKFIDVNPNQPSETIPAGWFVVKQC